MALGLLRIPNLQAGQPIVDDQGRPMPEFFRRLNDIFQAIQQAFNQIVLIPIIQNALVALDAATQAALAAADNANAVAAASQAETSIVNSFVKNPSDPVTANPIVAGAVTIQIASHTRQYGDPTLNPDVTVNAGNVPVTGAINGDVYRIYYDQPSRAGGAVTYQATKDPAPPPVQGGSRHSVGAITLSTTTPQTGKGVQPPGFVVAN